MFISIRGSGFRGNHGCPGEVIVDGTMTLRPDGLTTVRGVVTEVRGCECCNAWDGVAVGDQIQVAGYHASHYADWDGVADWVTL